MLPVLGVPKSSAPAPIEATESPIFRLGHTKLSVDAEAQRIDGQFTMLAGSLIGPFWHGVGKANSNVEAYASYRAQHEQLVAGGAIAVEGGKGRVTRNFVFPSPSIAGAVAPGRSCNGRRDWISPGRDFR